MKKLTNLKLKEFCEMSDSEMKSIRGGDGFEIKCPSGTSDGQCFGSCEFELKYDGGVRWVVGTCHYSGLANICACVES